MSDNASLEQHGSGDNAFFTDNRYWDCGCTSFYIHLKANGNYCPNCNRFMEESPDSRANEIAQSRYKNSDKYLLHKVFEPKEL